MDVHSDRFRRTFATYAAKTLLRACVSRARHGPTAPEWSVPFDVLVSTLRTMAKDTTNWDPARVREAVNRLQPSKLFLRPSNVSRERVGELSAEVHHASENPSKEVILYLHGGAYVLGSAASHRTLVSRLQREVKREIIVPDYRLAPEHPYPAALCDALAVYQHLLAKGHDPSKIIFAGDSAGGGLALKTAIALRDRGSPLPKALVLISPWSLLSSDAPSYEENRPYDYLGHLEATQYAPVYAGEIPLTDPRVSPGLAPLHDLPAVYLQAGERELLRDDVRALHQRFVDAGIPSELWVAPGMVHVWHTFYHLTPLAQEAYERIAVFLNDL